MKLQFTLDPAARRLERKIKIGYEFTVTNADIDPDNYHYGSPVHVEYRHREATLKDTLRSTLATYAQAAKHKGEFETYLQDRPYDVVHNDPGVIEISAPPTASIRKNTQLLALVLNVADKYGFVPYRGQECGGMHANVDINCGRKSENFDKEFYETKVACRIDRRIYKIRVLKNRLYQQFISVWYHKNITSQMRASKRYQQFNKFYHAMVTRLERIQSRLDRRYSNLDQKYYVNSQCAKNKLRAHKHAKAINMILNMFPSIAWTFHAPNDDDSAQIRTNDLPNLTYKHVAARLDGTYKFVEFRCVGMIGIPQQLKHVDIFFRRLALLAHQNLHLGEDSTPYPQTQKDFDKYTFKRAVHEFYHVCRILHLNPENYRWWLENHLQHRLNYTDEPHSKFRK